MISQKKSLLLAFIIFVLLFSVLSVLFWDIVTDTILVPIYYFVWVCGLLINSVPQGIYLMLLVSGSIITGVKMLESLPMNRRRGPAPSRQLNSGTRYAHWRTVCAYASANWLSKGRLAFDARQLILSIVAFEQGVDIPEAEKMALSGELDIPDSLLHVIRTKSIPDGHPRRLFWRRRAVHRAGTYSDPHVDQFLSEFIRFMESHLEIQSHA